MIFPDHNKLLNNFIIQEVKIYEKHLFLLLTLWGQKSVFFHSVLLKIIFQFSKIGSQNAKSSVCISSSTIVRGALWVFLFPQQLSRKFEKISIFPKIALFEYWVQRSVGVTGLLSRACARRTSCAFSRKRPS